MEQALRNIITRIDWINEKVGRATSWLTLFLVLLVCLDVITRYFFSSPQTWVRELEWHIFALIFLLGAGYAFKYDRHVRVDLFYTKMEEKDKALINLVGSALFLLPWCIVICFVSFQFGLQSLRINETSPDPDGLPARYIIKFSIAIGILLLFLQGISSVLESYLTYKNGQTPKN